jgi:hypothetical protein
MVGTDAPPRPRPAGTTMAAAGVMLAMSVYYGISGARSLVLAAGGAELEFETQRELTLIGLDPTRGAEVLAITGTVLAVLSVVATIAAVGLLARRGWAREAVGFLAAVFAFFAITVAIAGLGADPPAPRAWESLVMGVANLVVLGLILLRRTVADVSAAERWRADRRHRRRVSRGRR